MTELEKRLKFLEKDNAYLTDLLEQADGLITRNSALLDRLRRDFIWMMLVSGAAGVVIGICLARLVWALP